MIKRDLYFESTFGDITLIVDFGTGQSMDLEFSLHEKLVQLSPH